MAHVVVDAVSHVLGVDVSAFQPHVNWPQLRTDGYRFAYARCCDGLVLDLYHDGHVANAQAVGLAVGSYQFGHPSMDVDRLATFFLEHADVTELRPVIDMETLSHGAVPENAAEWADQWCELVKAATGTEPIIYASLSYWRTMCTLKPDVGGALGWDWWCAAYESGVGHLNFADLERPPKPVGLPYVAWQFAGNVTLPGQSGFWDVDVVLDESCDVLRV